jgi:tetratricopeptide (TPR) repeat protein
MIFVMERLRRTPLLQAAALALVSFLIYLPTRHDAFLALDDYSYVTNNPHVNSGLRLENILWAFRSSYEANWDPVSWISHMVDCQLFGLNASAHHLVNASLHALNAALLFLLLWAGTHAKWRSLLVAALFACHPLNVETVAWVAERKSLLSALFSLLALAAYACYARNPEWKRYLPIVAFFALAMLAKQMAVTLPALMLLFDYWPLERYAELPFRRRWSRLILEKTPLFAMSAVMSTMAIYAQSSGGAMGKISGTPMAIRTQSVLLSYVGYIGKMFWPTNLAVYYPHSERLMAWAPTLAAALLLAALTVAAIFSRRRYVIVGWLIYLIALLPVSGIIKFAHMQMADRFTYLPMIGLFVLLVWGAAELADAFPASRTLVITACICTLMVLTTLTERYLAYWKDGVLLLTHTEQVVPPDFAVEEFLASEMTTLGRLDEAYPHFQRACELNPEFVDCHFNMAIHYHRHQQYSLALEQYKLALLNTTSAATALSCLLNSARAEISLGNLPAANAMVSSALQIDPSNTAALQIRQSLRTAAAQ